MQRTAFSMILSSIWIRSRGEQQSHNLHTVTCGSKMQSRIARVDPMQNVLSIELPARDKTCSESGISLEQISNRAEIILNYGSLQLVHGAALNHQLWSVESRAPCVEERVKGVVRRMAAARHTRFHLTNG